MLGAGEAEVEEEGITVPQAAVPVVTVRGASLPRLCRWVPLLLAVCGTERAFAQTAPLPPAAAEAPAPAPSPDAPPEAAYRSGARQFQARIDAAALALRDSDPRLKQFSPKHMQAVAEFVVGNMLFVLLHESAHAAITQMGLPVLGRMEDAADALRRPAADQDRVGLFASRAHRGRQGLVHGRPARPRHRRQGHLLRRAPAQPATRLPDRVPDGRFRRRQVQGPRWRRPSCRKRARRAASGISATPPTRGTCCSSRIGAPISRGRISTWSTVRPKAGTPTRSWS